MFKSVYITDHTHTFVLLFFYFKLVLKVKSISFAGHPNYSIGILSLLRLLRSGGLFMTFIMVSNACFNMIDTMNCRASFLVKPIF